MLLSSIITHSFNLLYVWLVDAMRSTSLPSPAAMQIHLRPISVRLVDAMRCYAWPEAEPFVFFRFLQPAHPVVTLERVRGQIQIPTVGMCCVRQMMTLVRLTNIG